MDDVTPGMVLSDSVLDNQGSLLVQSGSALTESTLQSLRRRGIDHLFIVNDQISEEDLAADRLQQQERLAFLFRKYPDKDKGDDLLHYITLYRLGDPA